MKKEERQAHREKIDKYKEEMSDYRGKYEKYQTYRQNYHAFAVRSFDNSYVFFVRPVWQGHVDRKVQHRRRKYDRIRHCH